jgi:hypothetical protein
MGCRSISKCSFMVVKAETEFPGEVATHPT